MPRCSYTGLTILSALIVVRAALSAEPTSIVKDATIEQVRACRPLGQVLGESTVCSKARARRSALAQASGLGATHIIWLEVKCVPFVGEKASARIFDCAPQVVSLDEVFEDYLASDPGLANRTESATTTPRVMTSSSLDADSEDLRARGYVLVGYAGLSGGRVPLNLIRKKAAAVGAEIALVHASGTGEDVEYQAMTNYSRGGSGVAISSGFVTGAVGTTSIGATGIGTSVVTSPGSTQTQMVPYSQRRFDTQILCFRKLRAGALGLFLELIPPELRTRLQRNTGAYVVGVQDESPAFFANIVAGDIVTAINGVEVRTPAELSVQVGRAPTSPMHVALIRNGAVLEIEVKP